MSKLFDDSYICIKPCVADNNKKAWQVLYRTDLSEDFQPAFGSLCNTNLKVVLMDAYKLYIAITFNPANVSKDSTENLIKNLEETSKEINKYNGLLSNLENIDFDDDNDDDDFDE